MLRLFPASCGFNLEHIDLHPCRLVGSFIRLSGKDQVDLKEKCFFWTAGQKIRFGSLE